MPSTFAEIMAELEKEEVAAPVVGNTIAPGDASIAYQSAWDKLWKQKHGDNQESPYGGRNNALVRFLAVLKAKRLPFEPSIRFAESWNESQCIPPIEADEFNDTFTRLWKNFSVGAVEGLDPTIVAGDWEMLNVSDLLDVYDANEGIPWLIENFLKDGGFHIFAAPAAGAKSWVMMNLAYCFLTGEQWFGREVKQRPVFYIDEEMGKVLFADRINKLGYDRSIEGLSYLGRQGFMITNPAHLVRLVEWCHQNPGGVVFVDTLVAISDKDENINSEVRKLRPLFNAVTNTGATLIVAHHVTKGGLKEGSMAKHEVLRGAADLAAMVDMAYLLNKKEAFTEIITVKNRLTAEGNETRINFKLEDYYPAGDKRVRLVEIGAEQRTTETMQRQIEAVMECLSVANWKSKEEIMAETALSSGAVTSTLIHMALQGFVEDQKKNGVALFKILTEDTEYKL